MSITAEEKKKYFAETALALSHEGLHVEMILNGRLAVWLDDQPIYKVGEVGGITYRGDNISTPERLAAKDKAYRIVCNTAEFMRQMEQALPLKASDLPDGYKVLADFNGVVLAGVQGKYGMEFITWDWDHDRKGLSHGHYFIDNYEGAKRDFATRSGLVSEQQLFTDKQLIEIYRCCADTLDASFDLTYEQEKCIKSVQEQIKTGILIAELMVFKDHALLGLGLMLSAGEVPRIAGTFGLDTTTRANIMSAVYTAQAAVNTTRTVVQAVSK